VLTLPIALACSVVLDSQMTVEDAGLHARASAVREGLAQRRSALEQRRDISFFKAIRSRYQVIDGGTSAGLLSIQLFTTVLPLVILGFGYFNGFARNVSPGVLFERETNLHGALAQTVRDAFGPSDGLRSSWTILGMAAFLVWGIPMTVMVAGLFAKAWLREPLSFRQRMWRGLLWFVLYLLTLAAHDEIAFGADHQGWLAVLLFCVSLIPTWVFWTFTPALLVRDGGRGVRFLAKAGLAGLVINGVVLSVALRLFFPSLLAGWSGFGSIGVAMAIMGWCGVLGVGWVATACVGAVLWERSAPTDTVLAAEEGAVTAEPG
jgi:hypothetical protein